MPQCFFLPFASVTSSSCTSFFFSFSFLLLYFHSIGFFCLSYPPYSPPLSLAIMLSVPAKSAKRLSSIFSLGSSKDDEPSPQPSPNPNRRSSFTSSQPDQQHQQQPQQGLSAHYMRNARSAHNLPTTSSPTVSGSPRNVSAPVRNDSFQNPSPSPRPRPSGSSSNPAASESSSDSRRRRQSISGSLSNIASGFSRPASRSTLRPTTPNESRAAKGRSWVPGKARLSSVDMIPPTPPVPALMRAWVAGAAREIPYDISPLQAGEKVLPRAKKKKKKAPIIL